MRVVSSRELSSSLTRASASCSSDTSSSTSSSPVALEFKIKGCHFKCFKLSILETVCVWVCVMILSEGIIAWSCLQKQLLQGRNTHLACSANSLKSSHRENCQCSPLLIVINLGSQLYEMWTSSRNCTCHVFDIVFLWSDHDHRTLLFSKIQCLYLFLFLCLCLLVMKCFQCDHDFPQDNHCFHHEDLLITQTNIIILGNWPQKPV